MWRSFVLLGAMLALGGCTALLLGGDGGRPGEAGRTSSQAPADGALAAAVRSELAADTRIAAGAIRVASRSARVTLSGEVSSYAEREHAGRLAASVPGVAAVDNRLTVRRAD